MNSFENNVIALEAMWTAKFSIEREIRSSIKLIRMLDRENTNHVAYLDGLKREWKKRRELQRAIREWNI